MLIVESQSLDVYRNLAIEEYLMEHAVDQGPVLFLWQSGCAVVVGKNQNPWKECRLDRMRAEEVPLARRISGGGTVYHDAGNINYCVIVDRTGYSEQQAYDMVLAALEPFGIKAERTGKSNLSVNGLKFSGNAFCFRKGRALHHGTLLLNTDLDRLNRYLGSMCDGIETHAIASVPASVVNLQLSLYKLVSYLKESFLHVYRDASAMVEWGVDDMDVQGLDDLYARQRSEAWKYGATPRFELEIGGTRLEVSRGTVIRAEGPLRSAVEGKSFSEVAVSLLCSID
jgi:lipoate-protein ligase A